MKSNIQEKKPNTLQRYSKLCFPPSAASAAFKNGAMALGHMGNLALGL